MEREDDTKLPVPGHKVCDIKVYPWCKTIQDPYRQFWKNK